MIMKELVLFILQVRNQIQLFHWQTKSFAEHKAFDEYIDEFTNLTDKVVESLSGKYERVVLGKGGNIELSDYKDSDPNEFLDQIVEFFKDYQDELDEKEDSEIINLMDEITTETDKLKYLLTLNESTIIKFKDFSKV